MSFFDKEALTKLEVVRNIHLSRVFIRILKDDTHVRLVALPAAKRNLINMFCDRLKPIYIVPLNMFKRF